MDSYECQAAAGAQRCAFNARRSALLWRTSPHSLFTASSGYDNPEALGWPACPNPDSDHALPQRPLVSHPQRRAVAKAKARRHPRQRRESQHRESSADGRRWTGEVPTFRGLTGEGREPSACSSFLLRPHWHRGVRVGCGCACGSVCWVRVCARPQQRRRRRWTREV